MDNIMNDRFTPSTTDLQISTDDKFKVILNDQSVTEYREQQHIAKDELPYGKTLYARVRHSVEECGYSKWSDKVSFHVEIPANIIGVAIDTNATPATVKYIDMNGNLLERPKVADHAAFKNISMAELDTARAPVTMTKFPMFYMKTASSGPVGTYAENKVCYWISDLPVDGYYVHPAFKRGSTPSSYIYIGTYVGHTETIGDKVVLGSKQGSTVATGTVETTRDKLISYCKNRNDADAGEAGWHHYDIWDVALLRLLSVVWKCKLDVQSAYGTNTTASPTTGATPSKIIFRGTPEAPEVWVDDVWSTYLQHVDGISHTNGVVSLTSPSGEAITLSATADTHTLATTSGYVRTFISEPYTLGEDTHDLLELFLPKTVVGAEPDATVPDYYEHTTDTSYLKVGGYWESSGKGGIFATTTANEIYQESYTDNDIVRYDTINWIEDRRCGYKFLSYEDRWKGKWVHRKGTVEGKRKSFETDAEVRCDCPLKHGPYTTKEYYGAYEAMCAGSWDDAIPAEVTKWRWSQTCPKGWGRNKYKYPNEEDTVQSGQGYSLTGVQKPVYGEVTKYRDAYHNYYGGRLAKW